MLLASSPVRSNDFRSRPQPNPATLDNVGGVQTVFVVGFENVKNLPKYVKFQRKKCLQLAMFFNLTRFRFMSPFTQHFKRSM